MGSTGQEGLQENATIFQAQRTGEMAMPLLEMRRLRRWLSLQDYRQFGESCFKCVKLWQKKDNHTERSRLRNTHLQGQRKIKVRNVGSIVTYWYLRDKTPSLQKMFTWNKSDSRRTEKKLECKIYNWFYHISYDRGNPGLGSGFSRQ